MRRQLCAASLFIAVLMTACTKSPEMGTGYFSGGKSSLSPLELDFRSEKLSQLTPYIPPQCYARTRIGQGDGERLRNTCFTCHQTPRVPNYVNDAEQQLTYAFPAPAMKNPWTNLFVDRTKQVAAITDEEILRWAREDNYHSGKGEPVLASLRRAVPAEWDVDRNGRWDGWVPDIEYRFDDQGFDRTAAGGYTGWRAYAYFPLPGAFMPTNGGSVGDALIRLPAEFREREDGTFDAGIYAQNLEALAQLIQRPSGSFDSVQFVGRAGAMQGRGEWRALPGLFPKGTEFAHALYYLDVRDGHVTAGHHMKELRYMVKRAELSYGDLELAAQREIFEGQRNPDATRKILGNAERGIGNQLGWVLQGFIEDRQGALRPQTREEQGYCIGCHSGVGATDDSVFSFARKVPAEAPAGGWFHPTQRGLEGIAEPTRADGQSEYALYLEQSRSGDDFAVNDELRSRLFDDHGALRDSERKALAGDVSRVLWPSASRALLLDKAYRVIVSEQSFTRGRDATVKPPAAIVRDLSAPDAELATGITSALNGRIHVSTR